MAGEALDFPKETGNERLPAIPRGELIPELLARQGEGRADASSGFRSGIGLPAVGEKEKDMPRYQSSWSTGEI